MRSVVCGFGKTDRINGAEDGSETMGKSLLLTQPNSIAIPGAPAVFAQLAFDTTHERRQAIGTLGGYASD